ncbi:DsbA family protein [Polymorphospora rubra]|uniref:DsbA family protein n=1 Tax=Polymorphospora rubra TaxID=338584 RepID=UPI0031D787C2
MTTNIRVTLGVVAAALLVVAALLVANRGTALDVATADGRVDAAVLVRDDSHRLATAADGRVTLVEFLDFECEACGAAYPAVRQILADYDGRITFVVRYFPIPSHPNAELSAQAAQAAANQGRFPEMYALLFENQTQWGHQEQPQSDLFVGYAQSLGLDLERFRHDLRDPATAARVADDRADGERAGVQGTPTFFLNGRQLTDVRTQGDLVAAIEGALSQDLPR